MNKQELIESISHLPSDCSRPRPMIDKLTALELIKLLDEPQKVTVPQFVANWIESCKRKRWTLHLSMSKAGKNEDKVCEWIFGLGDYDHNNQETFALAWVNGYEVEQEKRYEVILSNGQSLKTVYRQGEDRLDFEKVYGDLERFTRRQLEDAGLSWVFDCPGIEVRELEEEK